MQNTKHILASSLKSVLFSTMTAINSSTVSSLPLHQTVPRKNTIQRAVELVILFLLFTLIAYRLVNLKHHGNEWLIALFCESCFALTWILIVSVKWNQVELKTYPDRLLQGATELPPVDIFVTTADPVLEPPIITVNTVLSLLAADYPANKLAIYVSDDGCSPVTCYSLMEASKFAKLWVPFCKKYDIQTRAPFRYFTAKSTPSAANTPLEFLEEWKMMKDEYGQLCKNIERSVPIELAGEFVIFANVKRGNHQAIVKVITENKEVSGDGVPHLVYVSREKRPKHHHHYKAGAMNALTQVSGVMTNAPFMLNVDCDMHANNPQIILHALCLLLGADNEDCAFIQFPQSFCDGIKDDPFGNQLTVLHNYLGHGIAGIQGPFYEGTGCMHRLKVIYGLSPNEKVNDEILVDAALQKRFGKSTELAKSAGEVLSGLNSKRDDKHSLVSSIEAANQVAGCLYEYGTSWGEEVGVLYGSQTEDCMTGIMIHRKGWRSGYCTPEVVGFLGSAPSGGPGTLIQTKRWSTGLCEILLSTSGPLTAALKGKMWFRQCLGYVWLQTWAIRSIPEVCYASLPAYCIITNTSFMPKVNEPAILLPISIFVIYYAYTLFEYIQTGLSVRTWWNNQRMSRVNCMTAWLFGFLSVVLGLLGISQSVFEVTQKEQSNSDDDDEANADVGRFTFDESPVFVPGTAILLVNLTALVIELLRLRRGTFDANGSGIGEIVCSFGVLTVFWAFLKGLFGTGKYGIPSSTIWKSGASALLFVYLFKWASIS